MELGLMYAEMAEKEYNCKKVAREKFHRLLLSVCDVSGDFGALVDIANEFPEQDINMVLMEEVGCTGFTRACYRGFEDVVFGLLQWPGIDIHVVEFDGNSALHHAVTANNRHMIEQLLVLGAKTTVPNLNGKLPVNLTENEFFKQIIRMPSLIVHRDRYVLATKQKCHRSIESSSKAISLAKYDVQHSHQSSHLGQGTQLPAIQAVGYVGASAISGRMKISMQLNPVDAAQLQLSADINEGGYGDYGSDNEEDHHELITHRDHYHHNLHSHTAETGSSSSRLHTAHNSRPNTSSSRPTTSAPPKGFIIDLRGYNESIDNDLDGSVSLDQQARNVDRLSRSRVDVPVALGKTSEGIDADTEAFARGQFGLVPSSFGGCRNDMFFSNCYNNKVGIKSVEESEELERLSSLFPQQYNLPDAFDHVEDWHETKDYLWLLGYPYRYGTTGNDSVADKRYILYKLAVIMNDTQVLFTEPSATPTVASSDTSIGLDESPSFNNQHVVAVLKFSVTCKNFVVTVIELFEPETGWPQSTSDALSRLLLLRKAGAVSEASMELLRKLLDFSPVKGHESNSKNGATSPMSRSARSTRSTTALGKRSTSPSDKGGTRLLAPPKELLTAPCRYRRVAVDCMFEVTYMLKLRAEEQFPVDSIRAHLWAHNGRKQLARVMTGQGKDMPLPVSGTAVNGPHSRLHPFGGMELWLQELQLSDYTEKLRLAGFRMLEDFLGLTIENVEEFFPFMQVRYYVYGYVFGYLTYLEFHFLCGYVVLSYDDRFSRWAIFDG
jgi:hypothetical protein